MMVGDLHPFQFSNFLTRLKVKKSYGILSYPVNPVSKVGREDTGDMPLSHTPTTCENSLAMSVSGRSPRVDDHDRVTTRHA